MAVYSFVALAFLPLIILLAPYYIEPYQLWDPISLNDKVQGERQTRWCNMGWWEDTDSFPVAAKSLAEKLLDFAREGGYTGGGNVLVLHLNSSNPPKHLHGLTSLSSDTKSTRQLIDGHAPETGHTRVELFTYSAQYNPSKHLDHPLNNMKGFMGEGGQSQHRQHAYSDEDELIEENNSQLTLGDEKPPPYDLIYILDSIYHYPPSLIPFLNTLKPVLRQGEGEGEGEGVVVYTDILPPKEGLASWKAWFISYFLSVPLPNLLDRPKSLDQYKELLEKEGWKDVEVQDWSAGVWRGFAGDLMARGGKWDKVGKTVQRVEKDGWRFVAVRAKKN
uniref:Uncharacterized protein n=1 Tax=Kwoniella dejecticola CBS 10117 TaxID=1296121 RepID=A0A1A6A8Z0_9TREE|nr:uncharacterized protein I303_02525 [Kwoniella dejecticola CBS 10117]OBR86517.1 hypothetical protein I303_02525 [Kwoniella dejecticola CBS 10117]